MNSVPHHLWDPPCQYTVDMEQLQADYEQDRSRLAGQTERLDNSRRALMHLLQDLHQANLRLEHSRKAMIHIMSDLKETTEEIQRREQELREKQEQLVQAGKLATLGELTTGVAHELKNPLNNIGLFVGNAMDHIELGVVDANPGQILHELNSAVQQVRKATEIISHLRPFGRAASVSYEPVVIEQVVQRALSLMAEQLRLRQIEVQMHFPADEVIVRGNSIQLEQVCWLLGTSIQEIGLFYTMEQAFLLKHVGYEYNQQSSFCVYAPTTRLFSRRRGSIRAVCIFLDQATRLFSLARVPRTYLAVDQTTDDLLCAWHTRRFDQRQCRTVGGKRVVATPTDHPATTGETTSLSEERPTSSGAPGQDGSDLETGPLSCPAGDTTALAP
jgi:hypothetical protein